MFEVQEMLTDSISNILMASNQNKLMIQKPVKQKPSQMRCYPSLIDFGNCIPGQVNQIEVKIDVDPWKNDIIVLHARCDCLNQQLDELPQYVFALIKDGSQQYSNQIKIKVNGQNMVKFTVAMKVPVYQGNANGVIVVRMLGSNAQPLRLLIKTKIILPKIICIKELSFNDNRITRIMIRTSKLSKKQDRKIGFRNLSQFQLIADTEIMGLDQDDDFIDCSPKSLTIPSNGLFNVIIQIRLNQSTIQYIRGLQTNYFMRRVLLVKHRTSSVIFHFPIEILFLHSQMKDIGQ